MTEPAFEFPDSAPRAVPARPHPPRPAGLHALPDWPGALAESPAAPAASIPGRKAARAGASLAVAPPRTVARPAAAGRHPVHVVVAVGITAGLYAVSLAGVTALQATTDTQLAADRAPVADAIARLRGSHDTLEGRLAQLDTAYASAADGYTSIAAGIGAQEKALSALGKQVKKTVGSAAAAISGSGSSTRLPGVSSRTVYVKSRPATNACTTASGKAC